VTTNRNVLRVAAVLGLVWGLAATPLVGVATQHASTAVTLSVGAEDAASIERNETVTAHVVVADAGAGVGSYDLTVTTNDTSVAEIVDARPLGGPAENVTDRTPASATVAAIGTDTANATNVSVVRVTVRGVGTGDARLSVSVDSLGDEAARPYAVTRTGDATVTVTPPSGPSLSAALRSAVNNVGSPVVVEFDATERRGQVREVILARPDGTEADAVACGSPACNGTAAAVPAASSWSASTGSYDSVAYRVVATNGSGATDSTTLRTPVYIAGDANGDGAVNIFDAVAVGRAWETDRGTDGYDDGADLNNDGTVDIFDAVAVGRAWQNRAG
jgi:hypothetical protein